MPLNNPSPKLSDLPLWRLLVALHDAERVCGSDSSTARTLAREIQTKLRNGTGDDLAPSREVGHVG